MIGATAWLAIPAVLLTGWLVDQVRARRGHHS
jgi:hypothetical protein